MPAKEHSTMTNGFHIPSELMQFVNGDTYSLLIKGHAGTGKTTLALTILKILNIKDNFQYISARVSPAQLYQYHPWLANHFSASKPSQLEEDNESEMPIFVDARLDEPSSMFERITNQLMDVGSPTIIIDTWDTVGYFMDKEALMNNARVLQTWRERAKAKMIFISENPQDATLDVLADGIVELTQKYHNERLLRKITISKLRGVKISRPSYKFTLNNAMFRSFEPYNPSDFIINNVLKSAKSAVSIENNLIKSGTPELDAVIGGGFPQKSVASIDFGPNVNWKVVLAILGQTISAFVSGGNQVLCRCSKTNSDYLSGHLKAILKEKQGSLTFVNQQKGKTQSMYDLAKKIKAKNPGRLLLSVVFSDAIKGSVTAESRELNQVSDLTMAINANSQADVGWDLSKNVDVSISFLEINGTLFMQSNIPWSKLFAVVLEKNGNQSHIDLEAVV